MLLKLSRDLVSSEITPHYTYLKRREFLLSAALGAAAAVSAGFAGFMSDAAAAEPLNIRKKTATTTDTPNSFEAITTYNNFYEFGSSKDDPARNSRGFKPRPWSVAIDGECGRPGTYTLEDILKPHALEERIYRFRCVEGWSMVIPWDGFPLADLLKRFEPTGNAKFVQFTTVVRPEEMPGQKLRFPPLLQWPYTEGLRIDEAMHPLALAVVGVYGQELPNQNGAPLRIIVPWKYGFKSAKSIVKITFTAAAPRTTWQREAPYFYGFYSNVNPVRTNSLYRDQSKERRIGEFLMRNTLPFNGYADQVASLYSGLDLQKNY